MSVIVNTDYESVLFHQKPSLKMARELEFLGLWLNEEVKNVQSYDDSYLLHIERYTGRRPKLCKKNNRGRNWWGDLSNLEVERFLNSKKTSLEIAIALEENYGRILENESDLELLDPEADYIFKSFSGVSGKGHKSISQLKANDFPLIAETLHSREIDFSTYCFSNGHKIFYQNFIGKNFGYKGSLFDQERASSLLELDFVKKYSHLDWKKYLADVDYIYDFVRERGQNGFSIDSYIFEQGIRSLCEINYRRTMGVTAFEIAKKVSKERFQLFLILRTDQDYFKLCEIIEEIKGVVLSHDKTMFSYLLLSDSTLRALEEKLSFLESILSTSFSIKIQ